MTLSAVKNLIMKRMDLDTIKHKRDQAPKQQNKKHIQKTMQKQSKGIGISRRKIIGTLLHREDSYFRINNRQIGLRKKKDSEEQILKTMSSLFEANRRRGLSSIVVLWIDVLCSKVVLWIDVSWTMFHRRYVDRRLRH